MIYLLCCITSLGPRLFARENIRSNYLLLKASWIYASNKPSLPIGRRPIRRILLEIYYELKRYNDISTLLQNFTWSQTLCKKATLIKFSLTRTFLDIRFQQAVIDYCEMIYTKYMVIKCISHKRIQWYISFARYLNFVPDSLY